MQITTFEQLTKTKAGETLFLINPFGQGDQSQVCVEFFEVESIDGEKFDGRIRFFGKDIDYRSSHFFSDMLGRCKYAFTTKEEAEEKLIEVRAGLHQEEVKEHHDWCDQYLPYRLTW